MKRCCECRQIKPLDQFHRSRSHGGTAPRCKPCSIKVAADWYCANKDRKRAYDATRREEKRHLYRAASKRFRDSKPGLKNADTQTRRAEMARRLPGWANRFFITEVYDLAARRSRAFGYRMVVDHVVPLRGKQVSGLHVETNLQIIPEAVNLRKLNKHRVA